MPDTTLIKPEASSSQQYPTSNGVSKKTKGVNYSKWGYFFITSFFLVFAVFSLVPLTSTFYNSLFEDYWVDLTQVGPRFVGLQSYSTLSFDGDLTAYAGNTATIWLMEFLPQIIFSLLLAVWSTDLCLHLHAAGFFKTVIYLSNLIMAAAFSMLPFTLFSDSGPVSSILISMGMESLYRFPVNMWNIRGLVALMNFLVWYGNTTILLMATIFGIDTALFEAAEIDRATALESFRKITLPLTRPIFIYVLIISLISNVQMFDMPRILTNGNGNPNHMSLTLVMYLNKHLFSENVGMASAVSVLLLVISTVLSVIAYFSIREKRQLKGGAGK